MANMKRIGYGQVEPNHLEFQITGETYAQLPVDSSISVLENGQFAKYGYGEKDSITNTVPQNGMAQGVVNFTAPGEFMLVYNEIKLYDDWRETVKDFAMVQSNYFSAEDYAVNVTDADTGVTTDTNPATSHEGYGPLADRMVPRLVKTYVGDIFTTNCFGSAGSKGATTSYTGIDYDTMTSASIAAGIYVAPSATTGYLQVTTKDADGMVWRVIGKPGMPDGQPGLKIQRIK